MLKKRKIVRGIVLIILLICTVCIIDSLVRDPLDTGILFPAIAVTIGFYVLSKDKDKK